MSIAFLGTAWAHSVVSLANRPHWAPRSNWTGLVPKAPANLVRGSHVLQPIHKASRVEDCNEASTRHDHGETATSKSKGPAEAGPLSKLARLSFIPLWVEPSALGG